MLSRRQALLLRARSFSGEETALARPALLAARELADRGWSFSSVISGPGQYRDDRRPPGLQDDLSRGVSRNDHCSPVGVDLSPPFRTASAAAAVRGTCLPTR